MIRKSLTVSSALALAAITTTACEPTDQVEYLVTTVEAGADRLPGDGVCEVTLGASDCTLEAAIQEGNLHDFARVLVPPGTYFRNPTSTVTGAIGIVGTDPSDRPDVGRFVVAEGGTLLIDAARTASLDVAGVAVLHRSGEGPLRIAPSGDVVARNSEFHRIDQTAVQNEGRLRLEYSTVKVYEDWSPTSDPVAITTAASATTEALATTITSDGGGPVLCDGTVTSLGFTHVTQPCAGVDGATDIVGGNYDVVPQMSSPLVDAIAPGTAMCGDAVMIDSRGTARPVDGNRDDSAGCDIGAVERPPG